MDSSVPVLGSSLAVNDMRKEANDPLMDRRITMCATYANQLEI